MHVARLERVPDAVLKAIAKFIAGDEPDDDPGGFLERVYERIKNLSAANKRMRGITMSSIRPDVARMRLR
jgi:hypothetical protein